MILFPKIGGKYWYITDFYETFYAIPVTVTARGGLFEYSNKTPALFTVEHVLVPAGTAYHTEDYKETYDASRRELYRTHRAAARAADRINRKADKSR
jgi:hypothetical protein